MFQIKSYKELLEEDFVKSTIEIFTILEYNSFLTYEINKISIEESTKNKANIQKTIHPFVDDEMLELFNCIIENWNYDKYSYIFNEIMPENHPPGEYEIYIKIKHKQIGKFNYNNAN